MSISNINKEKNFVYYDILSDSDNVVKDIARLLALGYESDEIIDNSGTVVKPTAPIADKCWQVVYPKVNRTLFPDIEDWNNLMPEEYGRVTEQQIFEATDTIILKTKTIPKDIEVNNSTAIGVNQDLNKASLEMYLEIYMPKYLCDSETDDPIAQRDPDNQPPRVLDVNGITNGNTRIARNYHHLFMRIFDHINEEGTGPAENEIDAVTRDVIKWNSRTSCWSKLSWYTDFEEKLKAPLIGKEELGMQLGIVRVPVIAGLTNETKIRIWANVNRSRVVLGVEGTPNVDYSDNRNLIGCAYIGQIESFDFSKNDTAGNFGLFCTSSTAPTMGNKVIKTRASVPAVINGNNITTNNGKVGSGTNVTFLNGLQILNPGTMYYVDAPEIPSIPYDNTKVDGGDLWGSRYVDINTVEMTGTFNYTPQEMSYYSENGDYITKSIGKSGTFTFTPDSISVDKEDKSKVKIMVSADTILKAFLGDEAKNISNCTGVTFKYYSVGKYTSSLNLSYTFSYYTEYTIQSNGVIRDKFGNAISEIPDTTYGKNTANGVTDFAMYATFTKDYFQKHYFMFASTEEFMQKNGYGKSVYTDEYFADRIKVIHSSEGARGILSGMITIDTSQLYPFDELIVNKDFEKYKDKPEELYIYLPVTAPYCPFANSPNGLHGIGILKDIRYPIPTTDEDIVAFAMAELERKYADLSYVTDDFTLLLQSEYGADITWVSSKDELITVDGDNADVTRPEFDETLNDHPSVTLVATVKKGTVSKEFELPLKVKMNVITDSRAVILDLNNIIIPKETKKDLDLPSSGANGSAIIWASNNTDVVSADGKVTRPNATDTDATVILTATCKKGEESSEKEFTIKVIKWSSDEELEDAAKLITWDLVKNNNTNSQAISSDLVLPDKVGRDVDVTWKLISSTADSSSSTGKLDIDTGEIIQPTHTQGQVMIQIGCELSKDGNTKQVTMSPFIITPLPPTDTEILTLSKTLLESYVFLGDNESLSKIITDMVLPYRLSDPDASKAIISWSLVSVPDHDETTSQYIELIKQTDNTIAKITRPTETEGNIQIGLKALIEVGEGSSKASDNKYFDLTILKKDVNA